jgi:hypothetical protein
MKACRSLPTTLPVPAVPPPVRGTFTGAVRPRAENAVALVVVIARSAVTPVCRVMAPLVLIVDGVAGVVDDAPVMPSMVESRLPTVAVARSR